MLSEELSNMIIGLNTKIQANSAEVLYQIDLARFNVISLIFVKWYSKHVSKTVQSTECNMECKISDKRLYEALNPLESEEFASHDKIVFLKRTRGVYSA